MHYMTFHKIYNIIKSMQMAEGLAQGVHVRLMQSPQGIQFLGRVDPSKDVLAKVADTRWRVHCTCPGTYSIPQSFA